MATIALWTGIGTDKLISTYLEVIPRDTNGRSTLIPCQKDLIQPMQKH